MNRRIVFVSPHPDDIELFCGGTLLHHAEANDHIFIAMMTKGELGSLNPFLKSDTLGNIREQEARLRYQSLPNTSLTFMGFKDAGVHCNSASLNLISEYLRERDPDIIYIPEFSKFKALYKHADHRRSGYLFFLAAKQLTRASTVRCYHTNEPNRYLEISSKHLVQNNAALKFYRSQNRLLSCIPFCIFFLNHYSHRHRKTWGSVIGCDYAEAFREINLLGKPPPNA